MKKILLYVALFGICTRVLSASTDYWEDESCHEEFHLGADWLYWKTQEEGLFVGSFDVENDELGTVHAKTIRPTPKYNNGFRINLGYTPICSAWEFSAHYTYIPIKSNSYNATASSPSFGNQEFFAINATSFQIFTGVGILSSLATKWSGNLSYTDIDCARLITFGDCFHLRPHIGFRGMWMDQKLFVGGTLRDTLSNNATFIQADMKEKWQAYGVEGGFWGNWSMGYGLSAIGHIGGSILYSNFKIKLNSYQSVGEDGPALFTIDGKNKFISATPTMDYLVGLQYALSFENISMSLHVAWEQHVLFNLNQIALTGGNFSVQGVNAGLMVSF